MGCMVADGRPLSVCMNSSSSGTVIRVLHSYWHVFASVDGVQRHSILKTTNQQKHQDGLPEQSLQE
eukprot:1118586-Amphidinium_carterae.1